MDVTGNDQVPHADLNTDELLATVYGELRNVARHRLAQLPPGQSISATALVHEVWLRIEGGPHRRMEESGPLLFRGRHAHAEHPR